MKGFTIRALLRYWAHLFVNCPLCLVWLLTICGDASPTLAQNHRPQFIRTAGTGGVGRFVPGHWGLVTTVVGNPSAEPIDVVAATFFEIEPHRQYGRQMWLPPRTRRISYYPVLAPADLPAERTRAQVKSLLVVPGPGGETMIPTRTGEMLHSGIVTVLHETTRTAAIVDSDDTDVRELIWSMRTSRELTIEVAGLLGEPFPPSRETLGSVDQLVISSDELLGDSIATQAVRQWLYDGGQLWLLVDHVSLDLVNALVGERATIDVVDRVDLSQFQIEDVRGLKNPQHSAEREFAEPVAMVRVVASDAVVLNSVDGWPAAMRLDAGRGSVLLTTVGPRAWFRDPTPDDHQPRESARRSRFVATAPLEQLGAEFLQALPPPILPPEQLNAHVRSRIGYEVVPRSTVTVVLGGFCLLLLVAGVLLARRKQLERLGVVGPLLALVCAGLLAGLGAASRGAVPATVVTSQFAEVSPDVPDIRMHGALAVYAPSATAEPLAAQHGGFYHFDLEHQAAQARRMLWTDVDRWHWQNVALPQGVHVTPFTYAANAEASPVTATAVFGPQGITGKLETGPFAKPQDALLATTAGERRRKAKPGHENGRRMAVQLSAHGTFASRAGDVLARGEYFSAATLDDDQRRRQAVLESLLQSSTPPYPRGPMLLVWCEPFDMGYQINPQAQLRGEALLAVPLAFERPSPQTKVVIPAPFLPCESVPLPGSVATSASYDNIEQAWIAPLTEPSRTMLRYSLPESVLPLAVDRASLEIDIKAPGREIVLRHHAGGTTTELARETSPVGTYRWRIDNPDALQLDAGGWLLEVDVGSFAGAGAEGGISAVGWQIDDIRLELSGTTQPRETALEQHP